MIHEVPDADAFLPVELPNQGKPLIAGSNSHLGIVIQENSDAARLAGLKQSQSRR